MARFDGVDLPDRACRILVLDGVPRGAFLFERFMDQALRVDRLRKAHINTRIVQAMGRIFRSNTDHGVVIICGSDLQRWIRDADNRPYFPPLLCKKAEPSRRDLMRARVAEEVRSRGEMRAL